MVPSATPSNIFGTQKGHINEHQTDAAGARRRSGARVRGHGRRRAGPADPRCLHRRGVRAALRRAGPEQPLPPGALPPTWLRRQQPGQSAVQSRSASCRLPPLLGHLGIERAHVVGHSSGGVIALRLALDAPELVHSLILLEPALLDVPSGALLAEALGPVLEQYGAGDKEGAADSFLRWAIGPDYRGWLDRLIPGAFQQLVADADTFFGVEHPSLQEWHFTRDDARAITQPVLGVFGAESASIWPGWNEVRSGCVSGCRRPSRSCSRARTTR